MLSIESKHPTNSYEDWNKEISHFFFNSTFSDKPVYLQLDDDSLTQIGLQFGLESAAAKDSFLQAVRSWLRRDGPEKDQFDNFFRNTRTWKILEIPRSPTSPPPFVAFLSLCVLAASKMNTEKNFSSANYYVHLNELLGFGKKRGQPRGFDQIGELWEELRWWLDEVLEGAFGICTAVNKYGGVHIGYPISQCLLRQTDREKLPDFFRWAGLEPGDDTLGSEDLRPLLQEWTSRTTCTFSQHGRRIFERNNRDLIVQITDLAIAEFQSWDGSSIDAQGRRTGEIKLVLKLPTRRFECTLYAVAPIDFPEGNYEVINHSSVRLTRPFPSARLFNPLSDDLLSNVLKQKPLILRQENVSLQFKPQPVIPFRNDVDSGFPGWYSCSKVGLGEDHIVLCQKQVQVEVEAFLQANAEPSWKPISARQEIFSLMGWVCFRNVRINRIHTSAVHDALDCLVPPLRAGIKLSGGLKVKRGVWLKGGEPEAIISVDSDEPIPIFIDGEQIGLATNRSAVVKLSHFKLAADQHTIQVGERQQSFVICESGDGPLLNQSQIRLGHLLKRESDLLVPQSIDPHVVPKDIPPGDLYVSGANILGSVVDVAFPIENLLILPYGGRRYIVLGKQPGDVFESYQPADMPLWMAEYSGYLNGHKITIPFEPQWIIKIKGNQKILLPVGLPKLPSSDISNQGDLSTWKQWARKAGLRRKLEKAYHSVWKQYNQMAETIQ